MPFNIHHGPPGSYKTSGAIQDDFIPMAKEGRVCITNVRGLDDPDLIRNLIEYIPDTFDIIHINTTTSNGKEKLRRFYEWAPFGAYFLIDEINTIYPTEWTIKKLRETYQYHPVKTPRHYLNDPIDTEYQEDIIAFMEMHRHYGWDFTFTTPSYNKVHSFIRDIAEIAFRHTNSGSIGLPGSYWEVMHNASNKGQAKSDQLLHKRKKIRQRTFKLYQSTTTGKTRDTTAGRNIFLQTKPFIVLSLIVVASYFLLRDGQFLGMRFAGNETTEETFSDQAKEKPTIESTTDKKSITQKNYRPSDRHRNRNTNHSNDIVKTTLINSYIAGRELYYTGQAGNEHYFTMKTDNGYQPVKWTAMKYYGYKLKYLDQCIVEIKIGNQSKLVGCLPPEKPGKNNFDNFSLTSTIKNND